MDPKKGRGAPPRDCEGPATDPAKTEAAHGYSL